MSSKPFSTSVESFPEIVASWFSRSRPLLFLRTMGVGKNIEVYLGSYYINYMHKTIFNTIVVFALAMSFSLAAVSTTLAWGGGDGGSNGSEGGGCCQTGVGSTPTPTPTPTPEPEPEPAICNFLRADKTSLPVGGGSVVLTWSSSKGTSATLTPDGSAVTLNGSKTVNVNSDTTFVFRVVNADGAASCQVRVDVAEEVVAPKCDSFTVSPTSLPYGGGNVTLSWATTDAGTVSINNGVGAVAAQGSKTVPVTQSTTFTLTASKAGANDATCTARVAVGDPAPISCANNVTFNASPRSLPHGGGAVALSWSTTGIDAVSINGVANPGLSGNATVNVTNDTTYTLTATKNGASVQCPLSIDVADPSGGGGGGGGSSSPKCTLKISDKDIKRGDEVTLTWTTTRVEEITLTDNHGNTIVKKTDDKDDLDSSIKIRPTKDTTYTLLGERGSKDRTCKVSVDVKDGVSISETRTQLPIVAGISLTQVPYTGFEAGPMLTTIFYILLTIWGLFVAYVVAVRRDMIGGVSLVGAHDHVAYTDASSDVQADVSPAATYVAAVTTPDVPANLPTGIAPVIGYASTLESTMTEADIDASIEMTELENSAHLQKALFSSDAMRYFMKVTPVEDRMTALNALIAKAKGAFPSEDGWLVINLTRLESLLAATDADATVAAAVAPGNGGSLAEAIVTGNVVAAYQLIAHRPMIALADAAAELDTVVRARRGEEINLSTMLANESARLSDEQIAAAIKALTSALDGVYTSEEDAVKMAIMKAVKVVA